MIKGWDDAPIEKIHSQISPKAVTFIYPYYCNKMFLARQIAHWDTFEKKIKDLLSVIVVDDGSPELDRAELVLKKYPQALPFPIRLFYIEVDIRFNWLAARNIAMHYAEGWCLGTDMDHVVSEDVAASLIWGDHNPNTIYRFSRREYTGEKIHSHPNSWFMTKEMFWKFGGYDETLSGYYGTDGEARRRWVKTARVRTLEDELMRYEYVDDSSTQNYKRKQPMDTKVAQLIKNRKSDWKPKVLSFPFHEVIYNA